MSETTPPAGAGAPPVPPSIEGRSRSLGGPAGVLVDALLLLLPVAAALFALQVFMMMGLLVYKEQFLAFFLTICLVVTFLTKPAYGEAGDRVPWYDVVLALVAVAAGSYVVLRYETLIMSVGFLSWDKTLVSAVAIVLLFEATRRQLGWLMVSIGALALAYAYFGHLLGGLFETRPIRIERLLIYNLLNQGSILGIPLAVAATIVTAFVLFGKLLFAIGGGEAICDLAFALMGRYRGGPAKVAVIASALFGSLSGSSSANVATTGMVTIPLMKRVGYTPATAGAIEAVASTGGLILPPIMAATVFLMAEFLEMSYAEVAAAAAVPAILYYICVFIQIDLGAARKNMRGMSAAEVPRLKDVLKRVWPMAIPAVVLVYALFGLFLAPSESALYAVGAAFLVSLAFPAMRIRPGAYFRVLVETGRDVTYIAVICALAGLIMGCLQISGLGLNLSSRLVEASGGSVWLLLILGALGSIVLGMGVPVTATYVILVVLVAPALTKIGISPLAAHMFIFYFGTLSFLTPPVCISVFVAAGIAGAPILPTAVQSLRLAVVAYLIPFLFVFNPAYLLVGSVEAIVWTAVSALAGVWLLGVAVEGYLRAPLTVPERAALLALALVILVLGPHYWLAFLGGLAGAVAVTFLHRWRADRAALTRPSSAG